MIYVRDKLIKNGITPKYFDIGASYNVETKSAYLSFGVEFPAFGLGFDLDEKLNGMKSLEELVDEHIRLRIKLRLNDKEVTNHEDILINKGKIIRMSNRKGKFFRGINSDENFPKKVQTKKAVDFILNTFIDLYNKEK